MNQQKLKLAHHVLSHVLCKKFTTSIRADIKAHSMQVDHQNNTIMFIIIVKSREQKLKLQLWLRSQQCRLACVGNFRRWGHQLNIFFHCPAMKNVLHLFKILKFPKLLEGLCPCPPTSYAYAVRNHRVRRNGI